MAAARPRRADRWSSSLKVVQSIPLDDGDIECLIQGLRLVMPYTQRIDRLIRLNVARPFQTRAPGAQPYFRCCAKYLFISNIVTLSLPKTCLSLSSARISRRFSGF